ncbi:thiamine pyrophosphokinase [Paraphysoderma sedebokerense]|nr:thiamine pyrophosphokinase [Paraphysoderma sedebokerense]
MSSPICFHEYLQPSPRTAQFALIILNQPLFGLENSVFENLWIHATWRICADGGANRLYDAFQSKPNLQKRFIPHLIRGDMDSLRPEVRDFYRGFGCQIDKVDCQDTTDLQKCYSALKEIEKKEGIVNDIIIMGGTTGRFDQVMSTIHFCYSILSEEASKSSADVKSNGTESKRRRQRKSFILDSENVVVILDKVCIFHSILVDYGR